MIYLRCRESAALPMTSHPGPSLGFADTEYWYCPLMSLMRRQMEGVSLPIHIEYNEAYTRIDELLGRFCYDEDRNFDLQTRLARIAFSKIIEPIYEVFFEYLLREKPGVLLSVSNERGRNDCRLPLEWYALHIFLIEHGVSLDVAKWFIELDRKYPRQFDGVRESVADRFRDIGESLFHNSLESKKFLEKWNNPKRHKEYRYLFSSPRTIGL